MLRALAVAAAIALVAAACGSEEERPALPISLGAGGGEAASAMAEDSAVGGASRAMPASVDYELDADTSNLPDEGPAYEVKSRAGESDVRELAEALGIDGDPQQGERGEWYVSGDGGALLSVEPVAGSPWYFQAEGACTPDTQTSDGGPVACSGGGVSSSGGVATVEPAPAEEPAIEESRAEEPVSDETEPAPPTACKTQPDGSEICEAPAPEPIEPERPANLPTKAEAEETARALFTKIGVDLDDATVRTEDGFSAWYVSVEPTIDGLPVYGFGWSVTVGPDKKIHSASGQLGDPTKVADYPLLSVKDAVEKLRSEYAAVTDVAVDCSDTPSGEGAGTEALCAEPGPSEPLVQRITAVELGLVWSPSYTEDGPAYLTPAWVLTIEGGGEMPVNALPDEYVQQPEVDDEPRPLPADGGGDPGEPGQSEPGSPGGATEPDAPPPPAEG